ALEHHALPVALRLAAHEHGAACQACQALSTRLLAKPGPVGGHAVARLGCERQGRDEPQHNWKGAEGPARLHPLQYGKEAWAAHPGRPDRARRLGFRPGREGNAVELGRTPTWHRLWANAPRTLLNASGLAVGLPAGQIGN